MNTSTTAAPNPPNIEKLVRLIVRTGHADKIMAALAIAAASGALDQHRKEVENV